MEWRNWELGRTFHFWHICFEFSVQCVYIAVVSAGDLLLNCGFTFNEVHEVQVGFEADLQFYFKAGSSNKMDAAQCSQISFFLSLFWIF
jgi:hypothetical protein